MNDDVRGAGWLTFAGIMILIVAVLNIVYGIAAIDSARFFIEDDRFIISNLNTWGWIVLIIGLLQLFAAFSIWAGGEYGRWVGLATASVSAVGALLSIPGYPFYSLAIFAIDVLIIYALATYGGQRSRATRARRERGAPLA
jgi:hypothetical protein